MLSIELYLHWNDRAVAKVKFTPKIDNGVKADEVAPLERKTEDPNVALQMLKDGNARFVK
jgi:hypothetical protein